MEKLDLLIIGTNNKLTGGIPRYIPEQVKHLPNEVRSSVYDIGAPEGSGIFWFIKSLFYALVDVIQFPFQSPPDVVHVHTSHDFSFYRSSVYVLFSSYVWRRPVLLHIHGSTFDKFVETDSRLANIYQSVVFSATDRVIVLSEYWKKVLSPYIDPSKITIIPNAVDPSDYNPNFDQEDIHIIFLSDMIERKGVKELIKSVDEILSGESSNDIKFSIAGKGPLSHEVERLAKKYENVEYHGYISEEEKHRLLNKGSIYVLPAHAEGLPIAILEAMAGGNAILSTTVGSLPETIDQNSGRLVPPGDAHALQEELEYLIDSPKMIQEMKKRNRQLIEEKYCWEVVSEKLMRQYKQVSEKYGK